MGTSPGLPDRHVEAANRRRFDALFSDPSQAYRLHAQGLLTYSPGEGSWLMRRIFRLTGLRLRPSARMLELGGGSGYASVNLALSAPGTQLTFVDLSLAAVNLSLCMSRREGVRSVGIQADATALPFSKSAFDVVVGKSFVHHIPELSSLLKEAWRVTQPGGWVLFFSEPTERGSNRFRKFKRAYEQLIHRDRSLTSVKKLAETPRYARTSHEIRALLKQLGIEGEVIETGIAAHYLGFLWYPLLLKAKSPLFSRLVNLAIRPLAWLDDVLLRRWFPAWNCEQWVILRRPADERERCASAT